MVTVLLGSYVTLLPKRFTDIIFVDGVLSYNIKFPLIYASPSIFTIILFETEIL